VEALMALSLYHPNIVRTFKNSTVVVKGELSGSSSDSA
jgi:hypothetical protein